jgi:hypothetical protein
MATSTHLSLRELPIPLPVFLYHTTYQKFNSMKFFIDTANLAQIKEANELGILDGVTTNPFPDGQRRHQRPGSHYEALQDHLRNGGW